MARQLKRFTDEQIERAKRVDVVEYARSVGLEIQRNGDWYKAKGKQGLYFKRSANTWHWESEDAGGRGAISLCMKLEGKTWIEAVKTLLNEDMEPIRHTSDWKPEPEPPKEFHLPDKNNTYRHVVAYLTKTRGIDSGIVKTMIDKGYIYENTQKSCVFVGRDKDGVPKHASVRSTNTYGKVFKQDVSGSQKAFSFSISGTSGTLNVFEAPIDVLSYMSLQKLYGKQMNDSYVALGGVTNKALERFLSEHEDIEKIRVCTDNDSAGENAVSRFYEQYSDRYKITRCRPTHKDFNEDLVAYRDKNMLLEKGISQKVITWYQNQQQALPLSAKHFHIQGTSSILFVCENPIEVFAVMELRMRNYQEQFEESDFVSNDSYLVYSDIQQVDQYLHEHPNIKAMYLCGGETADGQRLNKEISESTIFDKQNMAFCRPQMKTYADELALVNAVDTATEQSLQMDMAVGMEL